MTQDRVRLHAWYHRRWNFVHRDRRVSFRRGPHKSHEVGPHSEVLDLCLLLLTVNRSDVGVWRRVDFSSAGQREFRASGLIYTLRAANREICYLLRGKQAQIQQSGVTFWSKKLTLFKEKVSIFFCSRASKTAVDFPRIDPRSASYCTVQTKQYPNM